MNKRRWLIGITVVALCAITLGAAIGPPRPVTAAEGGLVPGSVTSRLRRYLQRRPLHPLHRSICRHHRGRVRRGVRDRRTYRSRPG